MKWSERRQAARAVLEGTACIHPASVHDPITGRIAQEIGFELGMFAGSIASLTVLAAPDLITLRGRDDRLLEVETLQADGDRSVMTLSPL